MTSLVIYILFIRQHAETLTKKNVSKNQIYFEILTYHAIFFKSQNSHEYPDAHTHTHSQNNEQLCLGKGNNRKGRRAKNKGRFLDLFFIWVLVKV